MMLYREDESEVCIIIIYIDDMLIIGKKKPLILQLKYCKVIFKLKIQQVWKIIWVFKVIWQMTRTQGQCLWIHNLFWGYTSDMEK